MGSEMRVALAIVLNPDIPGVLAVERRDRAAGGVWSLPGGKYERGRDSTMLETARREVFEEAGIVCYRDRRSKWRAPCRIYKRQHPNSGVFIEYIRLVAKTTDVCNKEIDKHSGVFWLQKDELLSCKMNFAAPVWQEILFYFDNFHKISIIDQNSDFKHFLYRNYSRFVKSRFNGDSRQYKLDI